MVWAFVPTAIILVAVALITFNAYQVVTEDLVVERDRETTRQVAAKWAQDLDQFAAPLQPWARTAYLYAYENDLRSLGAALNQSDDWKGIFDGGIVVLNGQGRVVVTVPDRPDVIGQNWSNRDYFQMVSHSLQPAISGVVKDGVNGEEVIAVAVPFTGRQGEFLGPIVGLMRVQTLANSDFYTAAAANLSLLPGTTYLVDGNGRVIYHPIAAQVGDNISSQEAVRLALRGDTGTLFDTDAGGQRFITSYSPVPGTPWAVISRVNWEEISGSARASQRILILLLVLGVALPALIVMASVGRVMRPVHDLIDAAQEVAGGNFSQRITASTGDEIEELAEQFNRMAAQLQESYANLEQRVSDRTRELATLNAVAGVVSRSLELDDILHGALAESLQMMDIEMGGIYLLDHGSKLLTLTEHKGLSPEFVDKVDKLHIGENLVGQVVADDHPIIVEDVANDSGAVHPTVKQEGIASVAVVPLSTRARVIGALFTATRTPRRFAPQDVQLLTSIGSQIAVAVENARLFEAEQRRAEQFRLISEVGRRITSILDTDELLGEIVRLVNETLGYYLVGIGLVEDDEVTISSGAGSMWNKPDFHPPRLKVGSEGITGWVARQGDPLIVADVSQDSRYYMLSGAAETRSELAVPIKTQERVIGVLDVQSDALDAFDEIDVVVLKSLAAQAAIAIDNARLYEQAQQVAAMQERNRLAHDLHDAVSQTLWTASLIADVLPDLWDQDREEGQRNLEKLRQLTRGALAEMRTLLLELRPAGLAETDLSELLRQLIRAMAGRKKMDITLEIDGECRAISSDAKIAMYRIAQEALNNVAKHAQASKVVVHLHCQPEQVKLTIKDNGRGFDPASVPPDRLGLGIMVERADAVGADIAIHSEIGQGTELDVTWPLTQGVKSK